MQKQIKGSIYIITSQINIDKNIDLYKVGFTKRSKERLIRRYDTSIPELVILLFRNCLNCKEAESKMKLKYKKYRTKTNKGNKQEWIKDIPFNQLENDYLSFIKQDNENILIDTYSDYIKHSCIKEIIVNDKNKIDGFIKFDDNRMWMNIVDDEFKNGKDNLKIWLEKNINLLQNHIINYDNVINDILIKCYRNDTRSYELKYHEYVIQSIDKDVLFDCKDKEYKNINNFEVINWNKHSGIYFPNTKNVRLNINKILEAYISYEKLLEFKKLCKGIFIEKSDEVIIFKDNIIMGKNSYYYLYELIQWICSSILHDFYLCIENECDISNITDNTRLVIINVRNNIVDEILKKISNKIKHIIVVEHVTVTETFYDIKSFTNVINKNCGRIFDLLCIKDEGFKKYHDKFMKNYSNNITRIDIETLFESKSYLFIDILFWIFSL